MRSSRPGTPGPSAIAAATAAASYPAVAAAATAASVFAALNPPGIGQAAGTSASGPGPGNVAPDGDSWTSVTRQSAAAPVRDIVSMGTDARSTRRLPQASSTLTNPR